MNLKLTKIQQLFLLIILFTSLSIGTLTIIKNFEKAEKNKIITKNESTFQMNKSKTICVYVCGEVAKPGLYYLPENSRIKNALEKAGIKKTADLTKINLAVTLNDEDMIHLPSIKKERKKTAYKKLNSRKTMTNSKKAKINIPLKSDQKVFDNEESLLINEGIIEIKR